MFSMANLMWQTQEALHKKNNPVVPGGLLCIACGLVVYRHMTEEQSDEHDFLKTFLAMILCQCLPLVALEMRIMSCADPVGLFCKFAVPVTGLHTVFLVMRFCIYEHFDSHYLWCSGFGLALAIITMWKGVYWSPRGILHHKSVWALTILCILGAAGTEMLDSFLNPVDPDLAGFFDKVDRHDSWKALAVAILQAANNYLEILAFVPAVWMVYREDKNATRLQIEELDTKRTSLAFFLFLVGFYLTEDVLNSYEAWAVAPLASFAHMVHFMLLLDFACYILAHIYNPEKLMGQFRNWLPTDLSGCREHDV